MDININIIQILIDLINSDAFWSVVFWMISAGGGVAGAVWSMLMGAKKVKETKILAEVANRKAEVVQTQIAVAKQDIYETYLETKTLSETISRYEKDYFRLETLVNQLIEARKSDAESIEHLEKRVEELTTINTLLLLENQSIVSENKNLLERNNNLITKVSLLLEQLKISDNEILESQEHTSEITNIETNRGTSSFLAL